MTLNYLDNIILILRLEFHYLTLMITVNTD